MRKRESLSEKFKMVLPSNGFTDNNSDSATSPQVNANSKVNEEFPNVCQRPVENEVLENPLVSPFKTRFY